MREEIVKDLGLDGELDSDLLDRLVEKEQAQSKKFGVAILQKQKKQKRIEELEASSKTEEKPQPEPTTKPELTQEEAVTKVLEKRDLEGLAVSDELKDQVRILSENEGISVNKAFGSKYIQFLRGEEEAKAKEEDASLSGKPKSQTSQDFSEKEPGDFDMTTKEGRADFAKYKKLAKENVKE